MRRFETRSEATMYRLLLALCLLLLSIALAQAQSYPTKTVRIIVPHGPGGPGDVPPRGIAQSLAQIFGQPFVVENREGADGLIGAEACAKGAPDGHTLCSTSSSVMIINPLVRSRLPYDPPRDFVPVSHYGAANSTLLINPSLKVNSVKELVELARSKPESIAWGGLASSGTGSLVSSWFRNSLGAPFNQIPFKSTVPAMQAAVSGSVQVVAYAAGPASGLVKAGKLKALAVLGRVRSRLLPDVPTLKELGYDFEYNTWFGMFAPAKTPSEIVHRLNAEIGKLLADREFNAKFVGSQGIEPDGLTAASPEELVAFLKTDRDSIAKVLNAAGIERE